MAQSQKFVSETERAVRAYADEVNILNHAWHLKESCGVQRALNALESAAARISKNPSSLHAEQRMH